MLPGAKRQTYYSELINRLATKPSKFLSTLYN